MSTQFEKRKAKDKKTDSTQEPNYNALAYDVLLDYENKRFTLVTIEYDIETGSARIKETKELADSQPVATYRMSELFTKKILGIK